jgi:hypothetical protein
VRRVGDALGHQQDDEDPEPDHAEAGALGDAREAERSTERFGVLDDDADDFAEAEGDDGEVVAFEAERGQADDEAADGGGEPADEQRDEDEDLVADDETSPARYAPTAMKPAWPMENCPVIPLMTFSETARMTFTPTRQAR